jgi:hypothetical protein
MLLAASVSLEFSLQAAPSLVGEPMSIIEPAEHPP